MDQSMATTTQSTPVPAKPNIYAGFWKRFLAMLIDQIIIGAVSMALGFAYGLIVAGAMSDDGSGFQEVVIRLVGLVAGWLYYALQESSAEQATLGKRALGIKVTDMSGGRITFGRATGRYFAKIISGITLGIGYIIAGFTEKKQALHDMIAGTLVVNKE